MAYLNIGLINLLEYVESGDVKWTIEKVLGKTIETRDGLTHENVLRYRRKISIDFPPLAGVYVQQILAATASKLITVTTDLDPYEGVKTMTMLCDARSANLSFVYTDGTTKWTGLSLDLVEQ